MKEMVFKDGKGNVVVTEEYFNTITQHCNHPNVMGYCLDVLKRRLLIEPKSDNYYLTKRYENQPNLISWYDGDAIVKVNELFKNTVLKRQPPTQKRYELPSGEFHMFNDMAVLVKEPVIEENTWKIEVAFRSEGDYLTISEDGVNNRPWTYEEMCAIDKAVNK